ncbi:hypothetical protein Tco_0308006 [Tanacetum coccineum]
MIKDVLSNQAKATWRGGRVRACGDGLYGKTSYEDEDPKEDEFEEKEDPQEDEDDMEIGTEEDENEPEMTYPYEEVDPLNPPLHASESKPNDEIEVENPIEHEDETVPVSVYEVGESSTAAIPREDAIVLSLRRRMHCSEEGEQRIIIGFGLNELREISIGLGFDYQEMIRRGYVFEERPNEAIDVLIEDKKSPLSKPQGSPLDLFPVIDVVICRLSMSGYEIDLFEFSMPLTTAQSQNVNGSLEAWKHRTSSLKQEFGSVFRTTPFLFS